MDIGWKGLKANLTCAKTAPTTHSRSAGRGWKSSPIQSYPVQPFSEGRAALFASFSLNLVAVSSLRCPLHLFPSLTNIFVTELCSITLETAAPVTRKPSALHPLPRSTSVHQPLQQAQILREAFGREPTNSYNEPHGVASHHTSRPLLNQAETQSLW